MLSQFEIKPSRIFVLLLIALHLITILSVCVTNFELWTQLCLSAVISISLIHHLYRHVRAKQAWRAFSLDKKQLLIHTLDGSELSGVLAHQTVVTPGCVVLCARLDGHRSPACQVIFRDAMPADVFRELRVRLRFAQ